MSRMATMQVLNQSFRNLNDALNSYMANRNRSRYMDLQEQAQQLEAARNEDFMRTFRGLGRDLRLRVVYPKRNSEELE